MRSRPLVALSSRHLIAVVGTFLIGCAVLLLVISCAGTSSEAPQEEQQGYTEATNKEQKRSPEATKAEEARCEGTRTTKIPSAGGTYITNDLPGCPKGGLLLGTEKHGHRYDQLAGEDGDDEIRGLGGPDSISGGPGDDMIYGGPGADEGLSGGPGDDVIYAGPGNDHFLDGSEGEDVIYGGDGNDSLSGLHSRYLHFLHPRGLHAQRDELYCGKGPDSYLADKLDYVDSSCEKKKRPGGAQA